MRWTELNCEKEIRAKTPARSTIQTPANGFQQLKRQAGFLDEILTGLQ